MTAEVVVRAVWLFAVFTLLEGAAFPARLSPQQAQALDAVREYALNYTRNLPAFTCTQVTQRTSSPSRNPGWFFPAKDVIEEQLVFSRQQEHYRVTAINGKKVTGVGHGQVNGMISAGEFGSILHSIFDPESGTEFEWKGTTKFRGREMDVFSYEVPQKTGTVLDYNGLSIRAGYKGLIYADAATRQVMRITAKSVNLPQGFPIWEVQRTIEYGPAEIAGKEYVLPLRFELRLRDAKTAADNKASFTSCRKFEAEATLTSGTDGEPEP